MKKRKDTLSMAKNKLDRALRALLDSPPSEQDVAELWQYFESRCAYCGKILCREKREGHLDHVQCASDGGSNSIHNLVLACGVCNGDQKREEDWEPFLRKKRLPEAVFLERKRRIEHWLELTSTAGLSAAQHCALIQILTEARQNIDFFAMRVRALRE
jgi:5-methylcytosine-specific restriction endonuclease McrA